MCSGLTSGSRMCCDHTLNEKLRWGIGLRSIVGLFSHTSTTSPLTRTSTHSCNGASDRRARRMRSALTPAQRAILIAVGAGELQPLVYFTGGTLLASRYLHHRRSLDVDLFSEELPDDLLVTRAMRDVGDLVGASHIHHVRYPNRWQYFLDIGSEEVKCDIVYFPFPAVGRRIRDAELNLPVDSLRDIAVNKVHACYERAAPRDAFDLYVILHTKRWGIPAMLKGVEQKFGIAIDPPHLIARIHGALDHLDDLQPLYIGKPPSERTMRSFFDDAARTHLRTHLP